MDERFFENVPSDELISGKTNIPGATTLPEGTAEGGIGVNIEPVQSDATGSVIFDEAYEGVEGAAKGLLYLPDTILNVAADMIESLGGDKIMIGGIDFGVGKGENGRDYLNRIINSGNYEEQKAIIPFILAAGYGAEVQPDTQVGRILKSTGEGVGLSPLFSSLQKIAVKGMDKLPKESLKTIADKVRYTVLEPFMKDPKKASIVEAEISGVAGAGLQLEKELLGTDTGFGALFLPFGWQGLKTVGLAKKLTKFAPISASIRWGRNFLGRASDDQKIEGGAPVFDDSPQSVKTQEVIKKEQEAMLEGQGKENLERSVEIKEKVQPYAEDDLTMSVAEATEDIPGLKTQSRVESKMDPKATRRNIQRKSNWFTALSNFIKGETDSAAYDSSLPTVIVNRIKDRNESVVKQIETKRGEVSDVLDDVVSDFEGQIVKTDLKTEGRNIQKNVNTYYNNAMEKMDKRSKELGLDTKDVNATRGSLAETIGKIESEVLQGIDVDDSIASKTINSFLKTTLQKLKEGSTVNFKEWRRIENEANVELSKAFQFGNANDIRDLTKFIKVWDEVNFRGNSDQTKNNLKLWKEEYRTNVIVPFRNATVEKVLAKKSGSAENEVMYKLPGEKVAASFLRTTDDVDTYMKIFADDADKIQHIKDAYLDSVAQKSIVNGKIDPEKLANILNKDTRSGLINSLKLDSDLTNVANTIRALVNRNQALTARAKTINSNIIIKTIAKLDKEQNPEKLIDKAIDSNSNELMNSITKTINSLAQKADTKQEGKDLIDSYNAIILNRIIAKAPKIGANENVLSDAANFNKFLDAAETKLKAAIGDEHFNNLKIIGDAYRKLTLTGIDPGTGIGAQSFVQKLEQQLGTSTTTVGALSRAAAESRISKPHVVTYLAGRYFRAQQGLRFDKMIEESLYNTELASLLALPTGKQGPSKQVLEKVESVLDRAGLGFLKYQSRGTPQDLFQADDVEAEDILFDLGPGASVAPTEEPPIQVAEITRPTNIPNPGMPQNNRIKPNVADLFPNDATSASIGRRQGITSLV